MFNIDVFVKTLKPKKCQLNYLSSRTKREILIISMFNIEQIPRYVSNDTFSGIFSGKSILFF